MHTSGVPHGLRARRERAWLCRLQNHAGRPVAGWRLTGDCAFCTACSRIARPSVPQSISRSMSNFGATPSATICSSLRIAASFCGGGEAAEGGEGVRRQGRPSVCEAVQLRGDGVAREVEEVPAGEGAA